MNTTIRALGGFCLFSICVLGASAQERGGISGTVADPSGASVAKASVKVTNIARGETIVLESTASGLYTAVNLIPGTYEVRVEAPGFSTVIKNGIDVKVAEVVRVDVLMKVGSVADV